HRLPVRSPASRSYALFPYTTLFRSVVRNLAALEQILRFSPQDTIASFGVAFPYTEENLNDFLAVLINREQLEIDTLCISPEKRADRKSTRLNSSHVKISYAVFCLKK